MKLRHIPLISALVCLAACGFQLRGTNLQALQESPVQVKSKGAGTLANEVKKQLLDAGIRTVKSESDAEYVITLSNEYFERSVLSVSPDTGKVEEYELSYRAYLTVRDPDGQIVLKSEPVTAERSYTFDEGSVLGKFEEENVLRRDIAKQAASTVLRRLQSLTQ